MCRQRCAGVLLWLFVALCLIFGIWGVGKVGERQWITYVMHRPMGRRHGQPDPSRIAALGPRAVGPLCIAIGQVWQQAPDRPAASLISWIRALGEIGDTRAVPTLIALTDHEHRLARLYAVLAMWKIGDGRCLPALRRVESTGDENVAWAARGAIHQIEGRSAPQ